MFFKIGTMFALIGAVWFMITIYLAECHDTQGNIVSRQQFWAYEQVDNPPWLESDESADSDAVEAAPQKNQAQPNPSQGLYRQWKW